MQEPSISLWFHDCQPHLSLRFGRTSMRLSFVVVVVVVCLVGSPAKGQVVNQIGEMVRLDRSKPVPTRDDVIGAWRKRQEAIRSFRFEWTEQQTHPKGWLPNPRLL